MMIRPGRGGDYPSLWFGYYMQEEKLEGPGLKASSTHLLPRASCFSLSYNGRGYSDLDAFPARLEDIDRIMTYDWVGLGYARLIYSLRHACRQPSNMTRVSIAGIWRIVELWLYSYFPHTAPYRPLPLAFPARASWKGKGAMRMHSVAQFWKVVRRIIVMEVNFHLWANIQILEGVDLTLTSQLTDPPSNMMDSNYPKNYLEYGGAH